MKTKSKIKSESNPRLKSNQATMKLKSNPQQFLSCDNLDEESTVGIAKKKSKNDKNAKMQNPKSLK